MREARDRGFLWRVERDGRTSLPVRGPCIARPGCSPGRGSRLRARGQRRLALDSTLLDPGIQRRLAAAMAPAEGDTLSPALARRLRAQLDAACLPPGGDGHAVTPEVQLAALTTLAARWDGLDPAYAIDGFLCPLRADAGQNRGLARKPRSAGRAAAGDPSEFEPALDSAAPARERAGTADARAHRAGLGRRSRRRAGALRGVVRLRRHRGRSRDAAAHARRAQSALAERIAATTRAAAACSRRSALQ